MLPKDFSPDAYEDLLNEKISAIAHDFERLGAPTPSIIMSPREGFRMRAEFRVWHEGDELDFVMFDRGAPKIPVPIKEFPIASSSIQAVLTPLREALQATSLLRHKLCQVDFLSTQTGAVLVTLIYHRSLNDEWEAQPARLPISYLSH